MGRLLAHRAVAEGARIVVADGDGDGIGALIGSLGHNYADGVVCDFRDEAQVVNMVGLGERRFGRLDAAFNPTYDSGPGAAVMEQSMTLCVGHEAERLIAQGRGGSITDFYADPLRAHPVPSLGPVVPPGLDALTREAGAVFQPRNVRINLIRCENIAEALTAARVAIYLASDAGASITGEVFDAGDDASMRRYPEMVSYLAEIRD